MFSDESEATRSDLITYADLERGQGARIKVIGVGGAGGNGVNCLIENGVEGDEFLVANTHPQSLKKNYASVKLHLGAQIARVVGAGGNPVIRGRRARADAD